MLVRLSHTLRIGSLELGVSVVKVAEDLCARHLIH